MSKVSIFYSFPDSNKVRQGGMGSAVTRRKSGTPYTSSPFAPQTGLTRLSQLSLYQYQASSLLEPDTTTPADRDRHTSAVQSRELQKLLSTRGSQLTDVQIKLSPDFYTIRVINMQLY